MADYDFGDLTTNSHSVDATERLHASQRPALDHMTVATNDAGSIKSKLGQAAAKAASMLSAATVFSRGSGPLNSVSGPIVTLYRFLPICRPFIAERRMIPAQNRIGEDGCLHGTALAPASIEADHG